MDPVAASPLAGAERLLLVRLDNIGDVLMLAPVLRALRAVLPGVHLTLLASKVGAQAAPLLAPIDEVLVERVVWQDASGALPLDPAREFALIERLRAGRFDAALIFTSWSQTPWAPAYACYLAGIPVRAGESKEFGGSLLTHRAPCLPDEVHQIDRNLHLVATLGVPPAGREIDLVLPPDARDRAATLLAGAGVRPDEPFVAMAPGASCTARRYAPERAAAVAAALTKEHDLPVVLLGSSKEAALLSSILEACGPRAVSLAGATDVPTLAAIVARAGVLIGNNSGPMHLADAFRRPTVVLYAGTDHVSQWEPRFAPARVLNRPVTCSPCYAFTCPYNHECLDLPPSDVVASVLALLEGAIERKERDCVPSGS